MKNLLLNRVKAEYPNIKVINHNVLHSRHSHVLEIETNDETLLFKFPNSSKYNFQKEIKILDFLKGRVGDLSVPVISYRSEKGTFIGYKKIEGTVPSWEEFTFLPKNIQKKLLSQLADFLINLHTAINLNTALKLSVNDDPSKKYIDNIKENINILDNIMKPFAEKLISEQATFEQESLTKHFIYNDLHPNNIILDKNSNLIGIIDFGFSAIGDIHREFHQMHKVCPDMLKDFISIYQAKSGNTISLKKVVWLSGIDMLSYLISLKNDKNPNKLAIKNTKQGVYNLIHE